MYHMIVWKQFIDHKMAEKMDIVKTSDDLSIEEALSRLKRMNAEARLTTADYKVYNLSEILADKGLDITSS